MKNQVIVSICSALLLSLTSAGDAFASSAAVPQVSSDLPNARAFGRRPAIKGATISGDGKHIVAVTSADGERTTVTVWQADDLRATPYVFGSDPRSQIISAEFVKKDLLFVTTQQLADFNILGQAQKSYAYRTQVLDLKGNPVRINLRFDGLTASQQAFVGMGDLVSSLPQDPQHVLVRAPLNGDVYKVNLYTGRAERTERGSDRFGGLVADLKGEIRARQEFEFENGALYIGHWLKDANGNWDVHFKDFARDRLHTQVVAFTNDPNVVLISTSKDSDRAIIYEYNIAEKKFGNVAFAHPVFEASSAVQSSLPESFGEILAFTFRGDRTRAVWNEPRIEAAYNQVRSAMRINDVPVQWTDIVDGKQFRFNVGDGADLDVKGFSGDLKRFVFEKSGGQTPPEFYVLIDGKITLLGRAYPELKDAPLGPVSLIQYPARDGLVIPAILTKPDPARYGPGPYPTIITPHGGPWARDDLDWDTSGWTQYFALRGYAVLQPQFRGSMGWGQKLWRAGDSEWGGKMQDDNDDGVRYLIAQGVAAPDRVAMHGYSYGGYASMMAAVRPNGLYQCAIAGAGPATIDLFKKGTYNNRYQREFQHPTANGADPLRRLNEISIPLYLYTGDRDTRVIPQESRAMAAAMERAGKPVKLAILPDMEHTMNTWSPANIEVVLTSIEQYLKQDCGPGGI